MMSALAAADRGPVAAGVFEQLVGGGQPQRPAAAAQPVVEDNGGDLAALAAAGAVAQHPAAPETHRRGQGFAVAGGIGGGFKGVTSFELSRRYWRLGLLSPSSPLSSSSATRATVSQLSPMR